MGDRLPVEIIYEILSRLPVKSLDRFRCVCKEWCKYIDDPNLAIIHLNRAAKEEPIIPIMFKQGRHDPGSNLPQILTLTHKTPEAKKDSVLEFQCNGPLSNYFNIRLHGSCNGLLYLSKYKRKGFETTLSVIHPLRNERYDLPPILHMTSRGLGFDASTNTFKMCVSVIENFKTVHTMVHVLGTHDSWREIPQIPYYLRMGAGIFAHGCLHWFGYRIQLPHVTIDGFDRQFPPTHSFKVISFDVRREEFGMIDPPRKVAEDWVESKLVDLNGELGLVYTSSHSSYSQELWVLKQNQWVIRCRLDAKPPLPSTDSIDEIGLWSRRSPDIVGLWSKTSGDILVTADNRKRLFVYSLKNRSFHEVNLVDWEDGCETFIHMYRSSLFSVPGIKKSVFLCWNRKSSNSFLSKKRRRKRRKITIPSKSIYRFLNYC